MYKHPCVLEDQSDSRMQNRQDPGGDLRQEVSGEAGLWQEAGEGRKEGGGK